LDATCVADDFEDYAGAHGKCEGRGAAREGVSEEETEEGDAKERDEDGIAGEADAVEVVGAGDGTGNGWGGAVDIATRVVLGASQNQAGDEGGHLG